MVVLFCRTRTTHFPIKLVQSFWTSICQDADHPDTVLFHNIHETLHFVSIINYLLTQKGSEMDFSIQHLVHSCVMKDLVLTGQSWESVLSLQGS